MSENANNSSKNLQPSPTRSSVSIPDINDKLKISLIHALDGDTKVLCQFDLGSYETFSYDQTNSETNSSEFCFDFFINCGSQVCCIDLIQNHLYSGLGDSILILVGTNSTSQHLADHVEYRTLVQLYSLNFYSNNVKSDHPIADLNLLCLVPIKNDHCSKLKWVKINYETGYFFAFLLLKSGSVKLCKFNVDNLIGFFKSNEPFSDRVVETEILWEFGPVSSTHRRFTCFDISYNGTTDDLICNLVNKSLVTLACGSKDGFVELWHFNLTLFQSSFAEAEDCECISSHKSIPILCGINNNLLSREITDISFLPFPNSYVLAVGTFSKGIILWDVGSGQSEGEIKSYQTISKPLNCVCWSPDGQYLLAGSSTGLFIEWQNRNSSTLVTTEKITKRKSPNLLDNICWSVQCSDDSVFFLFDSGELAIIGINDFRNIQISRANMGKRSIHENSIIYKWKLDQEELEDEYKLYSPSSSLIESLNYAMKAKFIHDLSNAKKHGITITRSFDGTGVSEHKTQVRNKVFSLNTVKCLNTSVLDYKIKLMAYGGNLGVVHLVLAIVHPPGE